MPGSWIRFKFLFAISGAMCSADLLLHLVHLATEILNQAHISHGQGQHFSQVQSQQEAGGTCSAQGVRSCTFLRELSLSGHLRPFGAVAPAGAGKHILCQYQEVSAVILNT